MKKHSRIGKSKYLCCLLSLALLFSSVFAFPVMNVSAEETGIPYTNSSKGFSAPKFTFTCDEADPDKVNASVSWDYFRTADSYVLNIYDTAYSLVTAQTVFDCETEISGLEFAKQYTAQLLAYESEELLGASMITNVTAYDASRYYSISDDCSTYWNSTTNTPDGKGMYFNSSANWIDGTIDKMTITDDAEALIFWVGQEIPEDNSRILTYTYQVKLEYNGSFSGAGSNVADTVYYVSTEDGTVTKHTRGADGNTNARYQPTDISDKFKGVGFIIIPLSIFDQEMINALRGSTVRAAFYLIDPALYNADGKIRSELQAFDRTMYIDNFGTLNDVKGFVNSFDAYIKSGRTDEFAYTVVNNSYIDSEEGFAAPKFSGFVSEDDNPDSVSSRVSWNAFDGAENYTLNIYDSMMRLVKTVPTSENSVNVNGLVFGEEYTAQVTASIDGELYGSRIMRVTAYNPSRYYTVLDDCSTQWNHTTNTPDGSGMYFNPGGAWMDCTFENITMPGDAEALILWVGQEEKEDGSRMVPYLYRFRFLYNGNYSGAGSYVTDTIYYVSTEDGTVSSHERGADGNTNAMYQIPNLTGQFRGVGFVIIPLSIFDQQMIFDLKENNTNVYFSMEYPAEYNADGSFSKLRDDNFGRQLYLDNFGTLNDVQGFLNTFDSYMNPTAEEFDYVSGALFSANSTVFEVTAGVTENIQVPLYVTNHALDGAQLKLAYDTAALRFESMTELISGVTCEVNGDNILLTGAIPGDGPIGVLNFKVLDSSEIPTVSSIKVNCLNAELNGDSISGKCRSISLKKTAAIGDANNDGTVDIRDFIRMKKNLADNAKAKGFNELDVNGDSQFDACDIAALRIKLLTV